MPKPKANNQEVSQSGKSVKGKETKTKRAKEASTVQERPSVLIQTDELIKMLDRYLTEELIPVRDKLSKVIEDVRNSRNRLERQNKVVEQMIREGGLYPILLAATEVMGNLTELLVQSGTVADAAKAAVGNAPPALTNGQAKPPELPPAPTPPPAEKQDKGKPGISTFGIFAGAKSVFQFVHLQENSPSSLEDTLTQIYGDWQTKVWRPTPNLKVPDVPLAENGNASPALKEFLTKEFMKVRATVAGNKFEEKNPSPSTLEFVQQFSQDFLAFQERMRILLPEQLAFLEMISA